MPLKIPCKADKIVEPQWSRLLSHTSLSSSTSRRDAARDPAKRLHRFEREYGQLLVCFSPSDPRTPCPPLLSGLLTLFIPRLLANMAQLLQPISRLRSRREARDPPPRTHHHPQRREQTPPAPPLHPVRLDQADLRTHRQSSHDIVQRMDHQRSRELLRYPHRERGRGICRECQLLLKSDEPPRAHHGPE